MRHPPPPRSRARSRRAGRRGGPRQSTATPGPRAGGWCSPRTGPRPGSPGPACQPEKPGAKPKRGRPPPPLPLPTVSCRRRAGCRACYHSKSQLRPEKSKRRPAAVACRRRPLRPPAAVSGAQERARLGPFALFGELALSVTGSVGARGNNKKGSHGDPLTLATFFTGQLSSCDASCGTGSGCHARQKLERVLAMGAERR